MSLTFKKWLSWLVPFKLASSESRILYRGEEWLPWLCYASCVEANNTSLARQEMWRAKASELEAEVREQKAYVKLKQQGLELLQARLEKAESKFEAACIVNHLQRQKQVSYEREVYAASMGGMILDNQEEIARLAKQAREAMKQICG